MLFKISNQQNFLIPQKGESLFSEQEIAQLAKSLSELLQRGDRVVLEGELGAGKSTFARYVLQALQAEHVSEGSPTYAIAHEYPSPKGNLIHIDFYRIETQEEMEERGIYSYYSDSDAIILCEWISKWPHFLNQMEKETLRHGKNLWKISLFHDAANPERRRLEFIRSEAETN